MRMSVGLFPRQFQATYEDRFDRVEEREAESVSLECS